MLAAALLASCHTPLYNAAERGDLAAVQQEIADGAALNKGASGANMMWQAPAYLVTFPLDIAQVALTIGSMGLYPTVMERLGCPPSELLLSPKVYDFGSMSPAEIAWEKGHADVLQELAKAGVAMAPASVAGKELILQQEEMASLPSIDMNDLSRVRDKGDMGCIDSYWKQAVSWEKEQDTSSLSWTDSNEVIKEKKTREKEGGVWLEGWDNMELYYKQTGIKRAMVTHAYSALLPGAGYPDVGGQKILLDFQSSTHGRYFMIQVQKPDMMWQSYGKFWLKDVAESSGTNKN